MSYTTVAPGAYPRTVSSQRLAEWGLPTHMARLWIDSAAASFRPVREGEIVLEYEADLGIVTCEMWSGGARVFGLDDWIG